MESSLLGNCQCGHNDLGEHQVNKFGVAMTDTDFSNLLIKSPLTDLRLTRRNCVCADQLARLPLASEQRLRTHACAEQEKC